ncbi:DUF6481 family protein [Methylobacterium planeticum]|uniref:Uncharacterized protein n=1 Tax=Methylobacterium planeticum TaxID=2615211 RepID=A0A6N6MK91_9HYPH|nr:DUF6481 family protein [Methylobacterium planeticum]KAB1071606.1 hypothetical protein F6X51_18750 [Methylobacterium planeticum]
MSQFKENQLVDRLETAAKAREALLARFRARPPADDPVLLARQAERRAVIQAREVRANEREKLRLADEARLKAETEARREQEAAEIARIAAEKLEKQAALAAEQKLARDARFAARKARARR